MMNKAVYLLLILIYVTNLALYSGWDIPAQYLSFLLTVPLLLILFRGRLFPTLLVNSKHIIILVLAGLSASFAQSSMQYNIPIIMAGILVFVSVYISSNQTIYNYKQRNIMRLFLMFTAGYTALIDLLAINTVLFTFPNPHIRTGFYIIVLPFCLYEIFEKNNEANVLKKVMIHLLSSIIILSFLRTGSIWGSVTLLIVLLYMLRDYRGWSFNPIFPFFPLIAIPFAVILGYDISERLCWLRAGLAMVIQSPYIGFGPGTTRHILPFFTDASYLSSYIHSFYLQLAAESGLIVLGGVLILIYKLIKDYFFKNNSNEYTAARGSVIGLVIYNILEYNLGIPLIYISFAIIAGAYSSKSNFIIIKSSIAPVFSLLIIIPVLYLLTSYYISTQLYLIGTRELLIGNTEAAEKYYFEGLDIYKYPPSLLGVSAIRLKQGDYNEAVSLINKTLPSNFPLHIIEKPSNIQEELRLRFVQFGIDPRELFGQD